MNATDTDLPRKIAEAQGTGYSPTQILDHIAAKVGKDKVAEARAAGYSDEDILKHVADINTPTSLAGEVKLSLTHSAPAMLERAAGGTLNALGIAPQMAAGLIGRARKNEAAVQAQDIVDPNAPQGVTDAISGADGIGDAVSRLGSVLGHGLARNAGPVAAGIGTAAAATAGGVPAALAALGLGGADLAMNLGGHLQQKEAAGLDGSKATLGDLGIAGAETGLDLIPGGKATSLPARMLLRPTENAARAAVGSVAGDVGTKLQGGDVGTGGDVLSRAADAAALGAAGTPVFHGATSAAGKVLRGAGRTVTLPARVRSNVKAGPDVKAYANETAEWDGAVAQAADRLRAQDPKMPADEVQSRAEQAATQAGLKPPTFDSLSPQAQNGAAELATLDMYQQRRKTEAAGMGRKRSDRDPADTFKGLADDVRRELTGYGQELRNGGLIGREDLDNFKAAISEAARHNRAAGEDGADVGYFDTLRDKVKGWAIDPAARNTILQHLRVLDIASQNGLKRNAKGFLERHAGLITSGLGAAAGAMFGPAAYAMGGLGGGVGGYLARANATAGLRQLDRVMGNQLPPVLRREAAIRSFAKRNGLQPGTTAGDLMALRDQVGGPAVPPPPVPPRGPVQPRGPVTSGPNANMGAAPPPVPPGLRADPAQAITPRPAPPPGAPANVPSAAPVVPPQTPAATPRPVNTVQALTGLKTALAARNARLARQAQDAFPSEGRSWSRAIANTLGIPHDAVTAAVKGMDLPAELGASLEGQTIPREVMQAITNRLADMRDRGELPGVSSGPNAPQGETIRNPMAYAASIRQAEAAANAVRQTHPELAPAVASIEAESHVADKSRALVAFLDTIPDPAARQAAAAILAPLTLFGDRKARAGTPPIPKNIH